jgi:hypothetical protein
VGIPACSANDSPVIHLFLAITSAYRSPLHLVVPTMVFYCLFWFAHNLLVAAQHLSRLG